MDRSNQNKLREREKFKEIVPPMRMQAKGSMERLFDSMNARGISNNTDKIALTEF